ncbi:MAG: TIGR03032 family protein [Planctomycetota bacterium]
MDSHSQPAESGQQPPSKPVDLAISASRHLPEWLARERLSLGFSTYQAGKMFLIGLQPDGRLSVYERTFNRCMGLHASADAQTIWMASLYQLWRMENYVPPGQATPDGYDRLYVPTVGYTTGDIDTHDIVVGPDGQPVFCATAFNCLATTSHTHSFKPVWKPEFISGTLATLPPEDRCHLNGLAGDPETGAPAYVTAVSRSDVSDGWRDRRVGGGVLIDVRANGGAVVAENLSMPHSPRVHPDYPGRVWLLNAGTGFFGYVDLDSGAFTDVAFCPGFTRGMAFAGKHAVVGLSAARENRTFRGMPLDENLASRDAEPRCALHAINLETGGTDHWLRVEGVVRELYDVIALRGVARPMLLGFKTDEIRRMLRIEA